MKGQKSLEVYINEVLESLEDYATQSDLSYPEDIGAWAVKASVISVLKANGQPTTPSCVKFLSKFVTKELVAATFEKYGLGYAA